MPSRCSKNTMPLSLSTLCTEGLGSPSYCFPSRPQAHADFSACS
jgi:hypothetical protein